VPPLAVIVTAVQVMPVTQPSQWQREQSRFDKMQAELLERRFANETVAAK